MKILLIASSYLPKIGGLENVTAALAAGLQRHHHTVTIITQRTPRTLTAFERIQGVSVHRWHFIFPRLEDLRRGRPDLFIAGLLFFPLTLFRLVAQIAVHKPDVVNLQFAGAPSLFLLVARRLIPFRMVVSLHGDDVEGRPLCNRFDRWILGKLVGCADAVTACSRYLLERVTEFEPQIACRGAVVYNGVQMERLASVEADEKVLAVGRLVKKKGFDLILYAMQELQDIRVRIIGDGPERDALATLATELDLRDRVEFCGAQSYAQVMRLMAAAKIVAIPSRQEPFGLVAIEAMNAGKPIVAARTGGLVEILEDTDTFFFESGNSKMLAAMLRKALDKLDQDPGFGRRNRERGARFSQDRMIDGYEAAYCAS